MKEDMNQVNEVRVKLHITHSGESSVKNIWMCLNYEQKPTICHVIDHVRRHFGRKNNGKGEGEDVRLYLEDFWLPPYENSRLLRENDCVKVEMISNDKYDDDWDESEITYVKSDSKQLGNRTNEANSYGWVSKHDNYWNGKEKSKLWDGTEYAFDFNSHINNNNNNNQSKSDYYNHYYESRPVDNVLPKQSFDPMSFWSTNDSTSEKKTETKSEETKNKNNKHQAKQQQQQQTKKDEAKTNKSAKSSKEAVQCHKKFAIGSYMQYLIGDNDNEAKPKKNKQKITKIDEESDNNISEEQIIDNYYESLPTKPALKSNKKQQQGKQQQQQQPQQQKSELTSNDVEKIAANVNSTGRQKWKNTNNSTSTTAKQNGPKHIIFSSTSSGSSSSDSSTESEDEDNKQQPQRQEKQQQQQQKKNQQKKTKKQNNGEQKKNQYYEPTKEEQLNSVSYNRSFFVQNTKNLIEFKKTFNETKLNAPQAEEFADRFGEQHKKQHKEPKQQQQQQQNKKNLNDSVSSTSTDSSSGSPNGKKNGRRSPSPKVDYEKFENVVGAPRVNDKIAFRILEISSNFTPEISNYKIGTVVEFNPSSNEVMIKMDSKYNSVLKRPNKFTVVIDDDEETDKYDLNTSNLSQPDDELLKVDWRNLMNVKLMPKLENTDCSMKIKEMEVQQELPIQQTV